jgi:cation transport ATPase
MSERTSLRPLTNAIALHNAAATRMPVAVFIGRERIGNGIIEEITEDSVKIGTERFMRANCSFWAE